MKHFVIFLSLMFSAQAFDLPNLKNQKRFIEMKNLLDCRVKASAQNPILVSTSKKTYELKDLRIVLSNYIERDGKKKALFSIEGTKAINDISFRKGSVVDKCSAFNDGELAASCLGYNGKLNVSRFPLDGGGYDLRFDFYPDSPDIYLTAKMKDSDCTRWPHGVPEQNKRTILFSVAKNNYCFDNKPVAFNIYPNPSVANPLKILAGVPRYKCVNSYLSSYTNYEYWSFARNTLRGFINPETFSTIKKYDIDFDGDLDTIKVEESTDKKKWDFVLYLNQ